MGNTDDDVKELREAINENTEILVRIDTMLKERCEPRNKMIQDLDCRVRKIENRIWWATGAATVAGAVLGKLTNKFFGS